MNYRFIAYEALVQLREALNRYPNHTLLTEINALISQVQDRKYIVAVAGEFNRGKSSLINALLGMPILPMDILPMTATANRIVYGLTPCVRVQKLDGTQLHIKINELAEYVTKQTEESHRMAQTIRETVIEYPTILCQNGLEIIDTPGLNDTEEMTKITKTILQEAHAVIFAVSAMMPLSMTEIDWLTGMIESEQLQYLMFAVTFFDRVAKGDRQKVLDNIRQRLSSMVQSRVQERYPDRLELLEKAKRLTNPDSMFLMPVASRDALDAFDLGDDELLQSSNLPQFKLEINTVLNAQQDEYVIRRANELLGQVQAWLIQANDQQENVNAARQLSDDCDAALEMLQQYVELVKQSMNGLYEKMETTANETPDAYGEMSKAAHAVVDTCRENIRTNDDVHDTLKAATVQAREAATEYYRKQWRERYCPLISQYTETIKKEHENVLTACRRLLRDVPQLHETENLSQKMWSLVDSCILPDLPEDWSLDITGGLLKDVVSGGQRMAEGLGKMMNNASDYMEKKSEGFRKMKGQFGEFLRKSGIAEKIESIDFSRVEIKEGPLTNRNLSQEIEPMLSQGASKLFVDWKKMPAVVGPILHLVYLQQEGLTRESALRLELMKRKAEAEALASQSSLNYEERFSNAQNCVQKAMEALRACKLA